MTDQIPLLAAERIVIDWLVAEYGKSLISPITSMMSFWWEYTNERDKQAYAEMWLGLNPNENNMKMLDALAVIVEARHIVYGGEVATMREQQISAWEQKRGG